MTAPPSTAAPRQTGGSSPLPTRPSTRQRWTPSARGSTPLPSPRTSGSRLSAALTARCAAVSSPASPALPTASRSQVCWTFVSSSSSYPNANDTATQCLAKLRALDHYQPQNGAGTVLMYGDRTGANGIYSDETAAQVRRRGGGGGGGALMPVPCQAVSAPLPP